MKPVLGKELVRTLNDKHGYFQYADAQGDVSVTFANEAVELFLGLSVEASEAYEETGKTPSELARSLADAQAEIARLRGALESASNYIDNLGGVSKTFRSYLNQ